MYIGGAGQSMRNDVPSMELFQSDEANTSLGSDSDTSELNMEKILRIVVTNGYECSKPAKVTSSNAVQRRDKGQMININVSDWYSFLILC
jgi:hypothetical protein